MPERDFAHVQDDMNPHILCMVGGILSLGVANLTLYKGNMVHRGNEHKPNCLFI